MDNTYLINQILNHIKTARSAILDVCEIHFSDQPSWNLVRSRLLRALGTGEAGLEGRVVKTFDSLDCDNSWEQ